MTPEEMQKALVAKDAEIAALKEKLAKLEQAKPPVEDEMELGGDEMSKEKMKELSDAQAKVMALEAKLKEKDAVIEMAEKTKKFEIMLSEGKAVEAQRDAFLAGDMTAFVEKAMPVKLSEIGNGGKGNDDSKKETGTDKVMRLAEEHTAKGMNLSDAVKKVLREHKDVREQYESENRI